MSSKLKETAPKEFIPETIKDDRENRVFARGKLMGKGGFAKCFELTDLETNDIYAGKIVPKSLLVKQSQKDKMAQEVQIHRTLNHPNIVKFYTFFEDKHNVYITLELCRRRSLMEMHKRRKAFTEPEARYFLKQIATACKYLHENQIIHRDLKLGNLFLNDEMELKVGDFGLATKLDHQGERKKTLCGTPNYIAPEVLNKTGHSFEVDVWSLGCILFTLLVGKPPFETNSLKETYLRIKKNEYWIPHKVSPQARNLIQKMLYPDPSKRPSMDAILKDPFMKSGYLPSRLPTSCLTMAPRFDQRTDFSICVTSPNPRAPLMEVNDKAAKENVQIADAKAQIPGKPDDELDQSEKNLKDILKQLTAIMESKPTEMEYGDDEAEDPAAAPMLWISKWVDYSDKYGLGYQLCDNSVGVLFNDVTKLILLADGENLHYIERDGSEHYYVMSQYPAEYQKKVTLVKYFRNYMQEHLLKAGPPVPPREGDELIRLPYLRTWFRTKSAIVLYLTNGILQVNFFQDHSKIIICPVMNAVTYINEKRDFRTFRLNSIERTGCSKELFQRLRYARSMVDKLLTSKTYNIPYINKKCEQ